MKRNKGNWAILLALTLGAAASYMVYSYLNAARQATKPVPLAKVVTAVKDIPARTVITSSMVHVIDIPASAKLPLAVTTPEQVEGKVVKVPVSQGEQLLPSKLFSDRSDSGLALVVPPGKRAVAVAVDEVVDSGGLLQPGDGVDVMAVIDTKAANPNPEPAAGQKQSSVNSDQQSPVSAVAQYILQNVEVLAVAQELAGDMPEQAASAKPSSSPAPKPGSRSQSNVDPKTNPAAHTVTLAVDPLQAERLVLAEDKGHIRLVVRPRGDDSTVKVPDSLFVGGDGMLGLKAEPRPS